MSLNYYIACGISYIFWSSCCSICYPMGLCDSSDQFYCCVPICGIHIIKGFWHLSFPKWEYTCENVCSRLYFCCRRFNSISNIRSLTRHFLMGNEKNRMNRTRSSNRYWIIPQQKHISATPFYLNKPTRLKYFVCE